MEVVTFVDKIAVAIPPEREMDVGTIDEVVTWFEGRVEP